MDFLSKLIARISEPSTWAGIAAIAYGVGEAGKVNEAGEIAGVAGQAAEVAAGGGGWVGALTAFAAGTAAIFLREKGDQGK